MVTGFTSIAARTSRLFVFSCNRAKRDSDQTDCRKRSKLVRDKIPDIIRAEGRSPDLRQTHGKALYSALCNKLVEEHVEFIGETGHDGRLEELADMIEVIHALSIQLGSSPEGLSAIVEKKRAKRGGFEECYIYAGDK